MPETTRSIANPEAVRASRVLLIEDDERIADSVCEALNHAGFQTEWVNTGDGGLEAARTGGFDLLVLDIVLPGLDGFQILGKLRESGSSTLILMLTSRDSLEDRVEGFRGGADDYLTKPFFTEELVVRVEALLRRASPSDSSGRIKNPAASIHAGNLSLDRLRREVKVEGRPVELTLREFDLLEYLMRAPGTVRPRAKIIKALWNYGMSSQDNILDVYIRRLRSRLSDAGASDIIETIRGVGYRVIVDDSKEG